MFKSDKEELEYLRRQTQQLIKRRDDALDSLTHLQRAYEILHLDYNMLKDENKKLIKMNNNLYNELVNKSTLIRMFEDCHDYSMKQMIERRLGLFNDNNAFIEYFKLYRKDVEEIL